MDAITIFLFICGFVLLVGGAEILVRGASQLAIMAGIPTLVIGLTIVAYGTSSPELAVTVQSTLAGNADLAIGNIVGSNIANILLILGISATIVPLFVSQQLVRLDVPLMIGISILLLILGLDGTIDRSDGVLLLCGALAYTAFTIYQGRKDNQTASDEVPQPFDLDQRRRRSVMIGASLGLVVIGLIMLVVGSQWMINGAITIAKLFGVSELVIGLTIVAIGTSLPEIATSVAACLKGERDLAVGNAIGSNIFNILLVIGMCGAIAPNGVPVANSALRFDIPIMIAVAAACLPIFFTGFRILRQEGILFLVYYAAYTLYLFFKATEHDALDEFGAIMLVFVVPITFLTLIVLAIQAVRDGRHRRRTRE
ncbi:MAG: calcium/sodium antiporter [Elainellaceae cyanobacterium]